jgi:transcriptional regulator with XRE-family HTH domain
MTTFFERLREERLRLGLNQTEFGTLGGVQKDAQLKYEAGKRKPDADYLSAIAAAGADVTYILTGTRVLPLAEQPPEQPEPPQDTGPLERKKAKAKAMIDQLETEKGVDAVQAVLEGIAEAREVRGKPAASRKKAG